MARFLDRLNSIMVCLNGVLDSLIYIVCPNIYLFTIQTTYFCSFKCLCRSRPQGIYISLKTGTSLENLFMTYANNKGTDQPAHPAV